MKGMSKMPRLKETCPICKKRYLHVPLHMKRYHPNGEMGDVSKLRGTNKPQLFDSFDTGDKNTLQNNADTAPILETNPEIDRLTKTVAEEEAKFGITTNPSPNFKNNPNQALESETEANLASDFEKEPENASVSEQNTIFDKEATNYITATIFHTIATLTKEKEWTLDKEELEIIGTPLNRVINRHAPDFVKKYPDEIVLITVFASILMTKAQKIQEKKKLAEQITQPPQEKGANENERRKPKPTEHRDDLGKFKAFD